MSPFDHVPVELFSMAFPVWYPIGDGGEIDYESPILAEAGSLPVDPLSDTPPGYRLEQRGEPGGFAGDPDVPLSERLDEGEQLLWGGGPTGMAIDWREWLTGLGGFCVLCDRFRF